MNVGLLRFNNGVEFRQVFSFHNGNCYLVMTSERLCSKYLICFTEGWFSETCAQEAAGDVPALFLSTAALMVIANAFKVLLLSQ